MNHSDLIQSLKERILNSELKFKEYDTVEFLISAKIFLNTRVRLDSKRWLTKDGVKNDPKRAVDHREYETLFLDNRDLFVLKIYMDKENMEIQGNIPLEEHGIGIIEEFKNPNDYISAYLNPHLEEGCEYKYDFYAYHFNSTGGRFNKYIEGVKQAENIDGISPHDATDLLYPLVIRKITDTFPIGKKTQIIAAKDKPLSFYEATTLDIINDIKVFYDHWLEKDKYWIECALELNKSENQFSVVDIEKDNRIIVNGEEEELQYFNFKDFEYLFIYLDESITKLEITIKNGEIKVFADKAFPEFGIQLIAPKDYNIATDDLNTICKFIESGVKEKIDSAVDAAYLNDETLQRIKNRYLLFVQAQLENENATLRDITEDMFSPKTRNICLDNRPAIAKNYINFGYHNEKESKRLIDFVGALTKRHVDVDQFMSEIDETYKQETDLKKLSKKLNKIHNTYQKTLQDGLNAEAKLNENGWWSQSCKILANLNLQKIYVEKSRFFEASRLTFLNEYMFYINATLGNSQGYIDVANCDIHDLTPVFWRFRKIPKVAWFQSKPNYPTYPYELELDVQYCIDNHNFKSLDIASLKK